MNLRGVVRGMAVGIPAVTVVAVLFVFASGLARRDIEGLTRRTDAELAALASLARAGFRIQVQVERFVEVAEATLGAPDRVLTGTDTPEVSLYYLSRDTEPVHGHANRYAAITFIGVDMVVTLCDRRSDELPRVYAPRSMRQAIDDAATFLSR